MNQTERASIQTSLAESSNLEPIKPALELNELSVSLGGKTILAKISWQFSNPQLNWLKGSNGAGKSTLLRAIVGLLPFEGEITIAGFDPKSIQAKASFHFVPDNDALYEDLNVHEHFIFSSRVYGQEAAEQEMLTWFERFGLSTQLDSSVNGFSRGMRQKVMLAIALGLDLPLLLLDEPFNALDADAQGLLAEALQGKVKAGTTVLFSAHQTNLDLQATKLHLREGSLHAKS
jgi:ABC-type multidrug transport system ATPase subunit